jgi:hypothetical protein
LKNQNLKLKIKTVSEKLVEKAISDLNKKKSSGKDGLGQNKLVMAKSILKILLTWIINESIENGEIPKLWKCAITTTILKKGETSKKDTTGQ